MTGTGDVVLVASADAECRRWLTAVLEEAGFGILEAACLTQALAHAARRPALVILDETLAEQETSNLDRLRALPGQPALLCIATQRSHCPPADLHLRRPADPEELRAAVTLLLRLRRAERENALLKERSHEFAEQENRSGQVEDRTEEAHAEQTLQHPPPHAPVTAELFGAALLSAQSPATLEELAREYGELIEQSLHERGFRVQSNISDRLQALGERLGFLDAGPRDVVEIHSAALQQKRQSAGALRRQAYFEEGRLTALELMGHLVSYYRRHTVAARKLRPTSPIQGQRHA